MTPRFLNILRKSGHLISPPARHLLAAALLALAGSVEAAPPQPPITIAKVLALPSNTEVKDMPVTVRGILTYYEPGHRKAFLQDSTGAIFIHVAEPQDVAAGDYVEVRGFIDPGLKGRNIRGLNFDTNPVISKLHKGTYPEPFLLPSLDSVKTAVGARWTRMEMNISSVSLEGDRARLAVEGWPHIPVFISGITRPSLLPGYLRGLRILVDGVMADAPISEEPLVMQRQILVPGLSHITIPPEVLARQFEVPEVSLSNLRWIQQGETAEEANKVVGSVTWVKPGEGFIIQKGELAAWIQCSQPALPVVGQSVICSGHPSSYQGAGILRNAIWTESPPPATETMPLALAERDFPNPYSHGRLSTIRGELVELLNGPSENLIILQVGKSVVFSHIRTTKTLPPPARGSLLEVTGAFLNRPSPMLEFGDTHGTFHILLREPADIAILAPPSFWTFRRVLIMLGAVLIASLLIFAWGVALRRKVNQQADVIRKSVGKQAVEEERVRIAREWHDMFEQHFAGLTMLLDATSTMVPTESPAAGMLDRAARMADHSRSQARHAIWDLRAPGLGSDTPFATHLAENLRHSWPDDPEERLQVRCEERDARFPGPVTQRLIRIANEGVTNAFKHADCHQIVVSWRDGGDAWILSIQDDGRGIPAKSIEQASSEGHFGLLGMRERALRLPATLEILSPPAPGIRGTLIRLTFPKTKTEP